ncbi:MAG: hypothetical protein WCL16_00755 [bacterium]
MKPDYSNIYGFVEIKVLIMKIDDRRCAGEFQPLGCHLNPQPSTLFASPNFVIGNSLLDIGYLPASTINYPPSTNSVLPRRASHKRRHRGLHVK